MNYNDQILENKAYNIFKQVLFDIVLAVCIMLAFGLVLVYGFKFTPYEVMSDSMAPVFKEHDMVIVKAQKEYKVGDILTYKLEDGDLATHRLIAIFEEGGEKYYVTHGDAVQTPDASKGSVVQPWEEDSKFVQNKPFSEVYSEGKELLGQIDVFKASAIKGKVVTHIDNYGTYINFIAEHKLLFITMIIGIWAVSATVQNEIEMKKSRRIWIG